MTSRVEELQRMCDSINKNGGLDSGEWHTAMLAQIAQNLAVIADVMVADHNDEPQTEEPTWEQVKEYCNKRCLDIVEYQLPKCENCINYGVEFTEDDSYDTCLLSKCKYEPKTEQQMEREGE